MKVGEEQAIVEVVASLLAVTPGWYCSGFATEDTSWLPVSIPI
jgi:hypothetical protein